MFSFHGSRPTSMQRDNGVARVFPDTGIAALFENSLSYACSLMPGSNAQNLHLLTVLRLTPEPDDAVSALKDEYRLHLLLNNVFGDCGVLSIAQAVWTGWINQAGTGCLSGINNNPGHCVCICNSGFSDHDSSIWDESLCRTGWQVAQSVLHKP